MLSKCANPECLTSFGDYRRGRLFRFHQSHPKGSAPELALRAHFWLCSVCSDIYTLEYREAELSRESPAQNTSPKRRPRLMTAA